MYNAVIMSITYHYIFLAKYDIRNIVKQVHMNDQSVFLLSNFRSNINCLVEISVQGVIFAKNNDNISYSKYNIV